MCAGPGFRGTTTAQDTGSLPAFTGGDRAGHEPRDTEEHSVVEMQTGVHGFHTHARADVCCNITSVDTFWPQHTHKYKDSWPAQLTPLQQLKVTVTPKAAWKNNLSVISGQMTVI